MHSLAKRRLEIDDVSISAPSTSEVWPLAFVNGLQIIRVTAEQTLYNAVALAMDFNVRMGQDLEVSFYPLLYALMASDDEASIWLDRNLDARVKEAVLKIGGADSDLLKHADVSSLSRPTEVQCSVSVMQWIDSAVALLESSTTPLSISQLVEALLFEPLAHSAELGQAGIIYQRLRPEFAATFKRRIVLPGGEEITETVAGKRRREHAVNEAADEALPAFAKKIESDAPTMADDLGHDIYALALREFIKSRGTSFPLSISIHAAWGGGKTSLMMKLRALLDPDSRAEGFLPNAKGSTVGDVAQRLTAEAKGEIIEEVLLKRPSTGNGAQDLTLYRRRGIDPQPRVLAATVDIPLEQISRFSAIIRGAPSAARRSVFRPNFALPQGVEAWTIPLTYVPPT